MLLVLVTRTSPGHSLIETLFFRRLIMFMSPSGGIAKFTDSGQFSAVVNPGSPATTDNCSVAITAVRSDGKPLNAPFPVGMTLITWTAKDLGGNTASCGQPIVIMVPS